MGGGGRLEEREEGSIYGGLTLRWVIVDNFMQVFGLYSPQKTTDKPQDTILQMCKLREVNLACPNSEMAVQCQSWDFESI